MVCPLHDWKRKMGLSVMVLIVGGAVIALIVVLILVAVAIGFGGNSRGN
jgi:hypothetical protein